MSTSYNIYSGNRYIGFCKISDNGKEIEASILLTDALNREFTSVTNHLPVKHKTYPSDTNHITLIKDMLLSLIPDMDMNGLKYSAKKNGKTFTLS
jgi:hypothetical protein